MLCSDALQVRTCFNKGNTDCRDLGCGGAAGEAVVNRTETKYSIPPLGNAHMAFRKTFLPPGFYSYILKSPLATASAVYFYTYHVYTFLMNCMNSFKSGVVLQYIARD